jgi:hypothetical protein
VPVSWGEFPSSGMSTGNSHPGTFVQGLETLDCEEGGVARGKMLLGNMSAESGGRAESGALCIPGY